MKKDLYMLTIENIKKLFSYSNGDLYWATAPCRRIVIGTIAGCKTPSGRRIIHLDKTIYYNDELIYILHTGIQPNRIIHIDGDLSNSKIENLKDVSDVDYYLNHIPANNKSGFRGVYQHKNGKWIAQSGHKHNVVHLGCFDTPEQAFEAYKKKIIELYS